MLSGIEVLLGLMVRIQRRDEDAMGDLFDETSSLLFGFALGIVGNREDAEEVLIDAYVSVWKMANQFEPNYGGVKRWLVLITRSRAIDLLRRRNMWRRHHISIEGGGSSAAQPDASGRLEPLQEQRMIASESGKRLAVAITRLPETQRRVIELSFYGDLTHTEIAEILRLPLGTIKTRIRLGLDRMRRILDKHRPAKLLIEGLR